MPRDSLELIEQHAALLRTREKGRKRTRLRSRVLDDWKADKVYPQDKPASYSPRSLGRDVLSGGYRRSEYQIEVHSRDYAKRVVSRRENHEAKEEVNSQVPKVDEQRTRSGKDGELPQTTTSFRHTRQRGTDSKVDDNSSSKPKDGSKQSRHEWSIPTNDDVSDLIVRLSSMKSKQRPSQ